jgi:hypothetical protein
MYKHRQVPVYSWLIKHSKDKQLTLKLIISQVEKGTGLTIKQLKKKYNEEVLFLIGLKHVTTTKKAFCEALNIPVEAGCRYKRRYEDEGFLVQSVDEILCPLTKHLAHLISTNPNEFKRLTKSTSNQTKLFENGI